MIKTYSRVGAKPVTNLAQARGDISLPVAWTVDPARICFKSMYEKWVNSIWVNLLLFLASNPFPPLLFCLSVSRLLFLGVSLAFCQ